MNTNLKKELKGILNINLVNLYKLGYRFGVSPDKISETIHEIEKDLLREERIARKDYRIT